MGKKHKNLFAQVVDADNIWAAYRKASVGKRRTLGYLQFRQNEAANIARLQSLLASGEYRPGEPRLFMVYEPKPRQISALPFVDRIAQHALCNVIEPIFDKVFLPQSHACRKGMGTHKAAILVQAALRKIPDAWILKTDFSRYFASIDRATLAVEIRRKISCKQTLALIDTFIPPHGVGLPIGNLTSQLAANIYGHIIDRWLSHTIGISAYVRYMDDVVIIGHSQEAMRLLQVLMQSKAKSVMGLNFSHWSVQPAVRGVNFCGYRIWATHKLLRRQSVVRAKRKITRYTEQGDALALQKFIASWRGHAQWANSFNLLKRLGVPA
ncbi:MAG: group II intron reverse transcriptase domain-containing protein [Rhodoferax sp.]|nr:group II intron reverse transcriptase domain-containing protein [Rhodoferax sp.]